MKITYPPLVEQGARFFSSVDQAEMYQILYQNNLITETGLPTKEALEKGYIKEYAETEGLSFEEFLRLYPVFQRYEPTLFQQIDGFWEIPISLKQQIIAGLATGEFEYDEKNDLMEYFADR